MTPQPDPIRPAKLREREFVEIVPSDGLAIDLRYASPDNFLGRALYDDGDRLVLHAIAAEKLAKAVRQIQKRAPGHRLVVFDGLRPNRIQRLMWAAVVGSPQQIYVADPLVGSIHGYGLAVDVSVLAPDGSECDMGTPFDDFSPLAEPRREAEFLREGRLAAAQVDARHMLRAAMTAAGFQPIAVEWWHFDALPPEIVRAHYELIE